MIVVFQPSNGLPRASSGGRRPAVLPQLRTALFSAGKKSGKVARVCNSHGFISVTVSRITAA